MPELVKKATAFLKLLGRKRKLDVHKKCTNITKGI